MKGRVAAIDTLEDGREIAALQVDGALEDLLVDPLPASAHLQPGAIFRGIVDRPMKGLGGVMVRLGNGDSGFLRESKGLAPGQRILVQLTNLPEEGKAAAVTRRILLKSRYAIVTPGRPGLNLSRQIRDEDERDRLAAIADAALDRGGDVGLILRSAAEGCADEAVHRDIADMADLARKITDEPDEEAPALLLEAPGAAELAWRDWTRPEPDAVHDAPGSFEALGIWEAIDDLKSPKVGLGPSGWMSVERTRALVAVDVNTGGDLSPAAGLKANIAALRALPRALRLRGYGGQITVDLAPFPKKDRKIIEQVLQSVLRNDPIETSFAGWTPLNNLELQRKRERPLLQDLLP